MKTNPPRNRRFSVAFVALSVLGAVAVFGMTASAAGAVAHSTTMKFTGHAAPLVTLVSRGNQLPSGVFQPSEAFVACQGDTPLLPTGPCPLHPPRDSGSPFGQAFFVPNAGASHFTRSAPTLDSNFLGMTDVSQRLSTGYHYTPPDQGLCVGPAGPFEAAGLSLGVPVDATVEFEMVNDGWAIFDTSGNTLASGSNADLFSDGNSTGDPECTYDAATQTYFFTEIGAPNNAYYTTNLAEINGDGYAAYNLDSSMGGGYCFPDFPHQGSDNHGLYITVNEFCGANEDYAGTTIFAISKDQLVAHSDFVNAVSFALGVQYFTFRPADGPSSTEYLLASEQNDVTQNNLDVAWVTKDINLTTGNGPVTLHLRSIPSQAYSEPVDALSTGDDSTCVFDFGSFCSVPEASLDPIDMRLEQVQNVKGQLFTSLTTSMTVGGDPTVVDGAAWFQVDTAKMKVVKQGYVGAAGTYMLDPSFVQSKGPDKFGRHRHFVMAFSMTSPTLNPSTGYVTSTNSGTSFSSIVTTGAGSGPHVSFSTLQPGYMRRRWGDYSRIAIDPATHNVWMADEYVPAGPDGADQVDNWGTQVWDVSK